MGRDGGDPADCPWKLAPSCLLSRTGWAPCTFMALLFFCICWGKQAFRVASNLWMHNYSRILRLRITPGGWAAPPVFTLVNHRASRNLTEKWIVLQVATGRRSLIIKHTQGSLGTQLPPSHRESYFSFCEEAQWLAEGALLYHSFIHSPTHSFIRTTPSGRCPAVGHNLPGHLCKPTRCLTATFQSRAFPAQPCPRLRPNELCESNVS